MSDSTLLAFMRRIAGGDAGAVTAALARAALEEKELFLKAEQAEIVRLVTD